MDELQAGQLARDKTAKWSRSRSFLSLPCCLFPAPLPLPLHSLFLPSRLDLGACSAVSCSFLVKKQLGGGPCRQTHACCPSWAQQGRHCLGMLSRSCLHPTSDHPVPISLSFLLSLQVLGPGHGRESLAYGFKNMFSVSTSVIKPLGPVTSSLSTPVPSDLTRRVSYPSSQ